jgi:hypothetical protein
MAAKRKKAAKTKARPRGRPCKFTKAIAETICSRLADGETLNAICKDEGLPPESTVRGWALDDWEGFAARYARARELGADAIADRMRETAKTASKHEDDVQHRKLIIDTDKWLLARVFRKKYGDRVALAGDEDAPLVTMTLEERARQLAILVATAAARKTRAEEDNGRD